MDGRAVAHLISTRTVIRQQSQPREPRLRVAADVIVGIPARAIALRHICGEEDAVYRVVVAGIVVVQPGERVVVLPGKALVRPHRSLIVALGTVGTVDLVTEEGGAARGVAESGKDAAQGVGEEDTGAQRRGRAGQFADEAASQAVVVGVALQGAGAIVAVCFQAEGVGGDGGGSAGDGAT